MKRFASFLAVAACLCACALASPLDKVRKAPSQTRSIDVKLFDKGLGITWVHDGEENFGAIAWDITPDSLPGRISVNALTVFRPQVGSEEPAPLYEGVLITYRVMEHRGMSASIGVGWKGVQLAPSLRMADRPLIFGLTLAVPLG